MYDLSSKFNTFYSSYVVLPQSEQSSLYHKKGLNLQRLKDGLKEYNVEYKTSYSIVEFKVVWQCQRSFKMKNPIMT